MMEITEPIVVSRLIMRVGVVNLWHKTSPCSQVATWMGQGEGQLMESQKASSEQNIYP